MSATATTARNQENRTHSTYRAAIVHDLQEPLTLEQVPDPELTADQVRVEIEARGLCHTHIHAAHGDWPIKPAPRLIPGHGGVGQVVGLGSAVTAVALAQRVALPWLGSAYGTCDHCVSGWETLCEQQQNTGYPVDGGFGRRQPLRGGGARWHRSCQCRAADVPGSHHPRGGQGRGHPLVGPVRSPSQGERASDRGAAGSGRVE